MREDEIRTTSVSALVASAQDIEESLDVRERALSSLADWKRNLPPLPAERLLSLKCADVGVETGKTKRE